MQRFSVIEGFRAVLAWWVVVGHCLGIAGFARRDMPDGLAFLRTGEIAVFVFMVISGFVITHLIVQKREPFHVYVMRRFLRLWPVFALVVTIVMGSILIGSPIRAGQAEQPWIHYILEMTMFHGLFPDEVLVNSSQMLGGPGWSISLEWQFYLVAPLLVAAFMVNGWQRYLVLAVCFALYWAGMLGDVDNPIFLPFDWGQLNYDKPSAIFQGLPFFGVGMLSYWIFTHRGEKMINVTSGLIIALLVMTQIEDYKVRLAMGVWIVIFGFLLTPGGPVFRIFDMAWLRWLGEISYSTYITHMLVLLVVRDNVMDMTGLREGWGYFWAYLGICAPIIIVISALSFYFIEKPAINFGRTLAKRWTQKPEMATDPPPFQPSQSGP